MRQTFLQPLIGECLSAVTFLMDHVQMDFNGSVLTALNPVVIRAGVQQWRPLDSGWRDALCGRIGLSVDAVKDTEAELAIEFNDGSVVSLSLRAEDYIGPEAFTFNPLEGPLVVG